MIALRVLLSLSLMAPPGGTESMNPRARDLLLEGIAAYDAGEHDLAVEAFRRAYAIDPRPPIVYAWAQAERQSGNCEAAVGLYQLFLDTGPPELQRQAAETNLQSCQEALSADEPQTGPAEPTQAPPVASPPPVDESAPPRPGDHASPRRPSATAITLLAGSGVATVVAAGLFGAAQVKVVDQRDAGNYENFDRLDDEIRSLRIGAGVAAGVTVGLLATGIAVLVVHRRRSEAMVRVAPILRPHAVGATLRF